MSKELVERLREAFDYDPSTGLLTWRIWRANHTKPGDAVGYRDPRGHLKLQFEQRGYLVHRVIWAIVHGEFPKGQIDHINRDRYDNRLANLRVVTGRVNKQNMNLRCSNKSGIPGVQFQKVYGKWTAKIGSRDTLEWLGTFDNLLDAACARKVAEIRHGYHPNHGKPTQVEIFKGQRDELFDALESLVDLKEMKDNHGEPKNYRELKPKLWAKARQVLNSIGDTK